MKQEFIFEQYFRNLHSVLVIGNRFIMCRHSASMQVEQIQQQELAPEQVWVVGIVDVMLMVPPLPPC